MDDGLLKVYGNFSQSGSIFFFSRNMIETVSTVLKDGDGKATETNHLVSFSELC